MRSVILSILDYFDFLPVNETLTLDIVRYPGACYDHLPIIVNYIWITLKQDDRPEGYENFSVTLQSSDPNVTISPGVLTVSIMDDDSKPCYLLQQR